MNIQVISRYRAQLRQNAQKWIARLAKSKRSDYIAEYRERIDEVRKCQRELWNIAYDAKTFPRVKIEAIAPPTFLKSQSLAAHIDSEHPEAEQPEIF
jgi:hypothetical protein